MDKLTDKKTLLDSIRLSEGTEFECNEKAILNEYQNLQANKSSLAIKVLSIFGGFLASLTFMVFLAITGLFNSELGLIIFGLVFIVSAIWVNKKIDKLIIDTFSISIYGTGLLLFAIGLSEIKVDENIISILIGIIALCSLFITQNYILSFISVLIISGSFFYLIISNRLYGLIHLYIGIYALLLTYFFFNEAKLISLNKQLSKLYYPLRIGLLISFLFGLISVGKKYLIPISQSYIWLSSVVMIVVILYLVYTIIKVIEINTVKQKIMIYIFSTLILTSIIFSPSILGAILIILFSFLVNYKTGLTIGIISIIYFISQYYYDLNFTLLTKSIILFISGILFLLLYLFTTKNLNTYEKI